MEILRKLNFSFQSRLPIILQSESSECGLACLAMIASYFGYESDLHSLRKKFYISSHGLNMNQLIGVAAKLNMAVRPVKVLDGYVHQLRLPCVIHWDLNHFVVLKRTTKNTFVIHDPSIGERKLSSNEFYQHFTGVAAEFTPTTDFKKETEKVSVRIGDFLQNVVGVFKSLSNIFLLSILLQFFAIASPFYMQLVVDDALQRGDKPLLITLAIAFGLFVIIEAFISLFRSFIILVFSSGLNVSMSINLYRHLIRLPMDFFIKRDMGDILSRAGSLDRVKEFVSSSVVGAAIDGIMVVLTIFVMFYYSWKLSLVSIVIAIVYVCLRIFLYRPMRQLSHESLIAEARMNTHNMESLRAMQTIKIFQKETMRQIEWQNKLVSFMNKNIRITKWNMGFDFSNHLLFGVSGIFVIFLGAELVLENEMSLGMFLAFLTYKFRFETSVNQLIDVAFRYKLLDVQLDRLADIVKTDQEKLESKSDSILSCSEFDLVEAGPLVRGNLELVNLSFSYGENQPLIFEKVNFKISHGECVVITGPSGSGKTTLLKCLMGLLKPSDGEILVDSRSLAAWENYRGQICGVMQDDQLLSGTLIDNIACFSSPIDINRIHECAKAACIYDEIMSMPMRFETLIGDMGGGISGGQKQRIILARALYRNPKILFMDEATSHLDISNEKIISQNIKQLKITRVIVAHRPETIAAADREIMLSDYSKSVQK